jgi:hypothetical protein
MLVLLAGCSDYASVERLINSSYAGDRIRGAYAIGEARDTSYVPWLLKQPTDGHISYNLRSYGVSVYQSKMNALRLISGQAPPAPITCQPDSTVVDFYRRWAIKQGLRVGEYSPQ